MVLAETKHFDAYFFRVSAFSSETTFLFIYLFLKLTTNKTAVIVITRFLLLTVSLRWLLTTKQH